MKYIGGIMSPMQDRCIAVLLYHLISSATGENGEGVGKGTNINQKGDRLENLSGPFLWEKKRQFSVNGTIAELREKIVCTKDKTFSSMNQSIPTSPIWTCPSSSIMSNQHLLASLQFTVP